MVAACIGAGKHINQYGINSKSWGLQAVYSYIYGRIAQRTAAFLTMLYCAFNSMPMSKHGRCFFGVCFG